MAVHEPDTREAEAAQQRPGVSRRALLFGGAGAVAVAATGGAALLGLRDRPVAGELEAAFVDWELPVTDPLAEAWSAARPAAVPLIPQEMTNPVLSEATLAAIDVRALFNGRDLGLLLEWDDAEPRTTEGIALFRDAVAVMLPARLGDAAEPPPVFMGWEGQPVYLAHWKASWQADIDEGYQDVSSVYPGWFNDAHPEMLTELGLTAEAAARYAPGRFVGNPLSQRQHASPVEELSAEGFGTLTHLAEQHAAGRGRHEGGRWHVALGIPGGRNAPELAGRRSVPVAFAVWQGEHDQRGGRKQYAEWTELTLPGA